MGHRIIHAWDEHRYHKVIADVFQMIPCPGPGYTIISDSEGNFTWGLGGGGGGGDSLWMDDGINLRPLSLGRGINLGTGDALADVFIGNEFNVGTPGKIFANGAQLRIEGPNGVEIAGLELQPIGTIFPQAGMLQYTGGLFQGYDGTQWVTFANTGGPPGGSKDPTWVFDPVGNTIMPANKSTGGIRVTNKDGFHGTNGYLGLAMGFDGEHPAGFEVYLDGSSSGLIIQGGDTIYMNVLAQPSGSGGVEGLAMFSDGCIQLTDVVTGYATPPSHERLRVVGGIQIAPALKALEGTIQYAGGHFQGRNATAWVNLDDGGGGGGPLTPTGVAPGVYGDVANFPVLDVHADGRIYVASEIPFSSIVSTALGPVAGDLHGTWPLLFLNDINPPIPAGTYGDAIHLPTFTVDTTGRITSAHHTLIRGARDPMPRAQWVNPPNLTLEDNTNLEVLSVFFTPLATGHGSIIAAIQGYLFNQETNPGAGTLHNSYLTFRLYFDGVLLHTIQRKNFLWEPGSGNPVTGPMEIPLGCSWGGQVGVQHHVQLFLSNFRTPDEAFSGTYPMAFMIEDSRVMIDEDPEPGIGTNSSYLMAGATQGTVSNTDCVGSWVAAYAFTLPGGLGGSWALSKTAAAGQVDFEIRVNGATKGTIRWANGQTVAGFNFPNPVSIQLGDLIEVYGSGGVTDTTWTLRGLL